MVSLQADCPTYWDTITKKKEMCQKNKTIKKNNIELFSIDLKQIKILGEN
jgi:hypothetical protein